MLFPLLPEFPELEFPELLFPEFPELEFPLLPELLLPEFPELLEPLSFLSDVSESFFELLPFEDWWDPLELPELELPELLPPDCPLPFELPLLPESLLPESSDSLLSVSSAVFSGPTAMMRSMAIFVVFSSVSSSLSFTPST